MSDPPAPPPAVAHRLAARLQADWLILVIIAAIIMMSAFETAALSLLLGGSLQSADLIGASAPLRNLLELLNFLSGIAVALIAAFAIRFARQQATEAAKAREEAENSRLTSIYMSIVERWNAAAQVDARAKVSDFVTTARMVRAADPALHHIAERDYEKQSFCAHLQQLKVERKARELRGYTVILQFFEDLGTLCRNRYIRQADVYDLLGSSIEYQIATFEHYIAEARKAPGTATTYANLIYLYRGACAFRGSRYSEATWPLPATSQRAP